MRFESAGAAADSQSDSLAKHPQPAGRFDARQTIATPQRLAPQGIHELDTGQGGGIKQWISVSGNERRNPILLFVHGGPGCVMMPLSWIYQRPWEDYLTVVQPDQRGAGKTFVSNDAAGVFPTVPYRWMVDDTEEIVEYR